MISQDCEIDIFETVDARCWVQQVNVWPKDPENDIVDADDDVNQQLDEGRVNIRNQLGHVAFHLQTLKIDWNHSGIFTAHTFWFLSTFLERRKRRKSEDRKSIQKILFSSSKLCELISYNVNMFKRICLREFFNTIFLSQCFQCIVFNTICFEHNVVNAMFSTQYLQQNVLITMSINCLRDCI